MPDYKRIVCISISALLLCAFSSSDRSEKYTGYAYTETGSNLVYTEEFTDKFAGGKHVETLTQYYSPDQKLIAKRTLDFRTSVQAPDYVMVDFRTGYEEGANLVEGSRFRLFRKTREGAEKEERIVHIPVPAVVDGGFNQFLKQNWSTLVKCKSLMFHFAVPARLDYFTLKAIPVEKTDTTLKIKVEPDKAVLRWLSSPIVVTYDIATRRITKYEGKSNVSNAEGINFDMRLVYPKKGP